MDVPDFNRISPTAMMTCLSRQFTDLRLAREMADAMLEAKFPNLPLILESRHKSIDAALAEQNPRQILELASGFLTRGLQLTENPQITFLESDLPEVIAVKKELAHRLAPQRPNHHFLEVDVCAQPNQLFRVEPHLHQGEPVHVLCEGLLVYLDMAEKELAARHVGELLDRYGGTWITTDFATTVGLKSIGVPDAGVAARLADLAQSTGRSLIDNAFASVQEARQFVERLGFVVEERPLRDQLEHLSCLQKTRMSRDQAVAMLNAPGQCVFLLRRKKSR